jgi:uncharacterized repeat protein (TIGR04138 family)
MHEINFEETVEKILQKDPRYDRAAYFFVRDALDHTQKLLGRSGTEEDHHVSGQELLEGIRAYALQQYGPMTLTVLHEWGVRCCEDFGELVFNLIEGSIFRRTAGDSRDDFKGGYDFFEAFRRPFLPSRHSVQKCPEGRPTRVL